MIYNCKLIYIYIAKYIYIFIYTEYTVYKFISFPYSNFLIETDAAWRSSFGQSPTLEQSFRIRARYPIVLRSLYNYKAA